MIYIAKIMGLLHASREKLNIYFSTKTLNRLRVWHWRVWSQKSL